MRRPTPWRISWSFLPGQESWACPLPSMRGSAAAPPIYGMPWKPGPLRGIGHGIAMGGQTELERLCRQKNIGIEMCPVSNLQTKAVESPGEYPLREFLDQRLKVTINTDNRTVSGSTLSGELEFVQESWGIRDQEIWQLMENAAEVSFAPDRVKGEADPADTRRERRRL